MIKRLVLVMLTALLLMSLAVNVSAVSDTYYPYEFNEVQLNQESGSIAQFSVNLDQNKAYLFKVVGNATNASDRLNAQISLTTHIGNEQYGAISINWLIGNNNPIYYCTIKPQSSGVYNGTLNMSGDYQSVTWRVFYAEVTETDNSEAINNAYNEGLQSGLSQGRIEGFDDGYQLGLADGQDSAEVLKNGIEGFFNGISEFMTLFMDIGIGPLTVRNMCGLCVIAVLIMVVVKVVRG